METKQQIRDARTIPATPLQLGLVGRGIQLSRTPAMHTAEAERQGLVCRYDLIDTDGQADVRLAEILDQNHRSNS